MLYTLPRFSVYISQGKTPMNWMTGSEKFPVTKSCRREHLGVQPDATETMKAFKENNLRYVFQIEHNWR